MTKRERLKNLHVRKIIPNSYRNCENYILKTLLHILIQKRITLEDDMKFPLPDSGKDL